MPKASRTFIDFACYHIMVRGNQQQNIFLEDPDRQKYLSLLKKSKKTHKILLYAYCLMSNHTHILIEAPSGKNISKFMHWVNRGYTAYFNHKYKKTGHLWQGRFKSKPIIKGQYLINAATYIENNPVRAGIVNDPEIYTWSSYRERCLLSRKHILDQLNVDCSFNS